jgi:translation initiation factor 2B subunit (eIF-2B alpha/beta/delta family)
MVRELAATGAPIRVPVVVACRVLKLSPQRYYKWLKSPVTQRDWDDAHLIAAAIRIHKAEPEFGYRLISDELAEAGYHASENRVARLCSVQRNFASHAKKRSKSNKPGPAPHDDLLAYIDENGRTRKALDWDTPTERLSALLVAK